MSSKPNLAEVKKDEKATTTAPAPKEKQPDTEEDTIFKTVQTLRNRAKKLSPAGRERLYRVLREFQPEVSK